ncbi:hypothetical protein P9112_011184 [Eukaryota sp. TZLM1-RC]
MGRLIPFHSLFSPHGVLCCVECGNEVAYTRHILSENFTGSSGPALLVDHCVNVSYGDVQQRMMITGKHDIVDVICDQCDLILGWRYLATVQPDQQYKINKFVLECEFVVDSREEDDD